MGPDHRIVPAIKQALSMLRQARETLLFAQCPAPVAKIRRGYQVDRGRASHRQATRAIRSAGPSRHASDGVAPCLRGGARQAMTLQEAKSIARHLGLTLRQVRSGDYRVNFRDGNETTAYYTDKLADAVNTAVEMVRRRAL
jgi:hypothetical protein